MFEQSSTTASKTLYCATNHQSKKKAYFVDRTGPSDPVTIQPIWAKTALAASGATAILGYLSSNRSTDEYNHFSSTYY